MKYILSLVIGVSLVVSGYSQTRNVLVGTNNTVVQPTNFWSADASNARSGLGLGSASTNSSSVFQRSSSVLTNLASSNGVNLTNVQLTSIVGWSAITNTNTSTSLLGFTTNGEVVANTGTNVLTFTNSIKISDADSLTISGNFLSWNGSNAIVFDDRYLVGSWVTDTLNIGSSIVFVSSESAAETRTNLSLGWSALTNSNSATLLIGFTTNGQVIASTTNVLSFSNKAEFSTVRATQTASSSIYTLTIGQTNTGFRGVGGSSSDFVYAIEGTNILGLYSGGVQSLVSHTFSAPLTLNYGAGSTAVLQFGGINSTTAAAISRTNLGLGFSVLTNTNTANFRAAIGIGLSALTNTNEANFRTAIGLELPALTNTNEANFRTNIGLGWSALTNTNSGVSFVSIDSTGTVVSPTNFWAASPLGRVGYIQYSTPIVSGTNIAEAARNLFVFSLNTNIVNVTNSVQLPVLTNGALYGDIAVVVHKGPTNSATIVRNGIDLIALRQSEEAISFLYGTNGWDFYPNLAFHEPIYFTTTNATLYAAKSRTNLALGATWLTNTNVTNFRTAVGLGVSNAVEFQQLFATDTVEIGTSTNTIQITTDAIGFGHVGIAAATRTNLGLGFYALTNTNSTNFQAAIFNTNTAPTNTGNIAFNNAVAWMEVNVVTNGSNVTFRVPLFKAP